MSTACIAVAGLGLGCGDSGGGDDTGASDVGGDTRADVGDTGATGADSDTISDPTHPDTSVEDVPIVKPAACGTRVCGPAPDTHEDCGTCPSDGGTPSCNDGVCEAACDDDKCEAMNYSISTCVSSGPCDGSPDGSITSMIYSCNDARTLCLGNSLAVDCGLQQTDCAPCDLSGSGDGLCRNDTCVATAEAGCRPGACGARVCGPAPGTHEDCGACEGTNGACNDGVCEATCDDNKCGALSYSENTCVSSGECDGSPEGFISTTTFSCNPEKTACGSVSGGTDCGLQQTDCITCDLNGDGDGLCKNDVCVSPGEAQCQ